MTEQIEPPSVQDSVADSSTGSLPGDLPQRAAALADERPEVAAGAAFVGGVLLALILKRLAR